MAAGLLPGTAFAADDARDLLKAMSDFMGKQKTLSFDYNSSIEVVTPESQKLQFASSGNVALSRPDRIKVNRTGGFTDIEAVFDGTTFSVLGRNLNAYAQIEAKGTLEDLGDKLANAGIEPPGADILSPDIYDLLINDDVTGKHISSAYIDGVECEYLAFRSPDVDWQIWIKDGDQPVPLRYVITSTHVPQAPQYTIDTRNWKFGPGASTDFSFDKSTDAKKVDLSQLC
ncbi:DUF2092 domain-containing protein [Mesorhizobium sp. SP-1A]|uniref:DUF2092 domain-containing protein n=1 Tax=Mesorhizobium sp. SP-1A TaxID=3077840 RepID=UPI0028F6EE8F|nr:DUF2092 domain-containing protein [Mesorhizobium sp. SP-1A]